MHQEEQVFLERRIALKYGASHALVRAGQIKSETNHEANAGVYLVEKKSVDLRSLHSGWLYGITQELQAQRNQIFQ